MKIEEAETLFAGTPSKLPAYRRLQLLITSQLAAGNLKAGDAIPSENEFVNALGISRMTVNRAMRELSAEGILKRIRGIGTFVAEEKFTDDFLNVQNIAEEIEARGNVHTQKLLKLEEINRKDHAEYWQSGQVPEELGETVFHSVTVHFEDGLPLQIEERFISPHIAPDYLKQDFTDVTPATYIARVLPSSSGMNRVDAILPSQDQYEILDIDSATPCLRVERHTYSEQELVSSACFLHPGTRIRLEGEFGK